MIFKLIVIAVAIAAVHNVAAETYTLEMFKNATWLDENKHRISTENNCKENGHTCVDCRLSVYCFQIPGGDWIEVETDCEATGDTCLKTCPADPDKCGQCVSEGNYECETEKPFNFKCYISGLFPHPFSCTTYYLCLNDDEGKIIVKPTELKCENGFAYDPISTLCRKNIKNCNRLPLDVCKALGDMGVFEESPNLFYLCLSDNINGVNVITPQFLRCAPGEVHVGSTCISEPKYKIPLPLDDEENCEEDGIYYSEDDCKEYVECKEGEEPITRNCAPGQYFDVWNGECKQFTC